MSDVLSYLNFDPIEFLGIMLWWLPAFLLLSVPALVLHEAGHALVGACVGIPIRRMQFGRGAPFAQVRLGRLPILFAGRWPIAGYVLSYTTLHASALARMAYFAGGIGFNLLAAGLAVAVLGFPDDITMFMFLYAWVAVNLLLAFQAARPKAMRGMDGRTMIARDGAKIIACFRPNPALERWRRAAATLLDTFGPGGPKLTAAEARAVALGSQPLPDDPAELLAFVAEVDDVLTRTPPGRAQTCLASLVREGLMRRGAKDFEAIVTRWPVLRSSEAAVAPVATEVETV